MHTMEKTSVERLMLIGLGMTLAVLLLVGGIALTYAVQSITAVNMVLPQLGRSS